MTGGGGATQLTLSGGQDKYLHFDATASFFDSQHMSYEDFAVESILVDSQGSMNFNRSAKFKFTGAAELVVGGYLETTIPQLNAWTNTVDPNDWLYYIAWVHSIGIYLYKSIEFSVNNTKVDIYYPQFIDLWGRLLISNDKRNGYNDMIGELNFTTTFTHCLNVNANQVDPVALQRLGLVKPQTRLYLPLSFWWCNSYSQALPVGLLLFSDVYVNVEYAAVESLYVEMRQRVTQGHPDLLKYFYVATPTAITRPSLVDSKLYIDYVYVSEYSRERLAAKSIFYVIKQVRSVVSAGGIPVAAPTLNYRLPFVMPCTSLLFGIQEDGAVAIKRYDWWDRYRGNVNTVNNDAVNPGDPDTRSLPAMIPDSPLDNATLKILGTERFANRDWLYWSRYQPYRHNTKTPITAGVYVYHFALFPEQEMASGAANLSHSDNNYLYLVFNRGPAKDTVTANCGIGSTGVTGTVYIYAINHNYLYVEGGYVTILYNI